MWFKAAKKCKRQGRGGFKFGRGSKHVRKDSSISDITANKSLIVSVREESINTDDLFNMLSTDDRMMNDMRSIKIFNLITKKERNERPSKSI